MDIGGVTYEGGDGATLEQAIVIRGAPNHLAGVEAEYAYLERAFGQRGRDWHLAMQTLHMVGDRPYDEMRILLADGTEKPVYFDLSDFFGKW
ncbi:MAG: hypothetical protein H5T59_00830 [Anaerolineae bacterium]|nr:hypothetical protein [Anaerolineae bacterium]